MAKAKLTITGKSEDNSEFLFGGGLVRNLPNGNWFVGIDFIEDTFLRLGVSLRS